MTRDGTRRHIEAKNETWHITFYNDGRNPAEDACSIEVERHEHNFHPTLTAKEAGALVDALLDLMPETLEHITAEDLRKRRTRRRTATGRTQAQK